MLKKFKHADIVVESDSNFDFALRNLPNFYEPYLLQI